MSSSKRDELHAQRHYFSSMCVYYGKKLARGEEFDVRGASEFLKILLDRCERLEDEYLESQKGVLQ